MCAWGSETWRCAIKRHELDLTSLISGAIFVAVGMVFLVDLTSDYTASPRWVAALVLIGVGLAGLLSTVGTRREAEPVATVDSPIDSPIDDFAPIEPKATESER